MNELELAQAREKTLVITKDWAEGAERLIRIDVVKGPPLHAVYVLKAGKVEFVELLQDPVTLADGRIMEGEAWPDGSDMVIGDDLWTRGGAYAVQGASVADPVTIWSGPLAGRVVSGKGWKPGKDKFFPVDEADKVQRWHYRRNDSDDGATFIGIDIRHSE